MTVFFVFALASGLLLPEAGAQTLSPSGVPRYVDPLPRVCGLITTFDQAGNPTCLVMSHTVVSGKDYYEIASRQFQQPVLSCSDDSLPLPAGCNNNPLPKTTLWGFGPNISATDVCLSKDNASIPITKNCFHSPAATIAATFQKTAKVKWFNDLKYSNGNFVTYPPGVPFNQDVHWANPSQDGERGRGTDRAGTGGTYFGPIPTVVHLHGISAESESDGIPEAWNLPAANNIPVGFARHGSDYCQVNSSGVRNCTYNLDGAALFQYPNAQYPATLFFHDHTLGITLQNVYMGLVGYYLLGGGQFDLPIDCGASLNTSNPSSCKTGGLPGGDYEIPLAIQDKSFNTDGSLFLKSEGDFKVVNGKTWPYLEVEPRKYRFRFVNGANESFMGFTFPEASRLKFIQIGADGGFLPHPVTVSRFQITPGERADVIVDFSGFKLCVGSACNVILLDDGAGVMQFRVVKPLRGTDTSVIPTTLPHQDHLCPTSNPSCETSTRKVALFDHTLGTFRSGTPVSMKWDDPITENVMLGSNGSAVNELWEIYDLKDSHPIHLHEVQFEVVNREKIATGDVFNCIGNAINALGNSVACKSPPVPGETGFKDTVLANGGQITRVRVRFGPTALDPSSRAGLFAWHCHIIEHEDEEMMRPLCIVDPRNPAPVHGADGIVGNTNPGCPSRP